MNRLIARALTSYLLFLLSSVSPAWAATYYVAPPPLGRDANAGTLAAPWETFAKAFSAMTAGDTLYLLDGVYHQQLTGMPSGTPTSYTKIYALNDHRAEIDGQELLPAVGWEALLYISGKSFVEVRGLRVHGSSATNHVCGVTDSQSIILRVTACWQAGTYKHDIPVHINASTNVLVEDVWAFGRGRYAVLVFSSSSNTLRRVVTRWDTGAYAGEPNAGVSIYNSSDNIIENNITLDHNSQNVQPDQAGFYLPANIAHSDTNHFFGNIVVNLPKAIAGVQYGAKGFYVDPATSQGAINNVFVDNVIFNADFGVMLGGTTTQGTVLKNNTFGQNYQDGLYNGSAVTGTIVKNGSFYKNARRGLTNTGQLTLGYSGMFGNAEGVSGTICDPGCLTVDPGMLYMTRVEPGPYKGAGEGGADIGANVVKRYQAGALTLADLWPWPYEDWIKQDMCAAVGETRGFCSKISLTEYIWTFLGSVNPFAPAGSQPPSAPVRPMVVK